MKWQQREYSPQQMQQMQQEALERVRQMQQRSRQILKRPSRPPSFIFRGCKRRFPAGFSSPRTGPAADSRSALAAVQRPLHRQHPDAGAALPVFVALIPKRNLPLKSVILLHRSMAAARKTRRPPSRSLIRNFLSDDHPFVMGPRISYPLCSISRFSASTFLSSFSPCFFPYFILFSPLWQMRFPPFPLFTDWMEIFKFLTFCYFALTIDRNNSKLIL